MSWSTCVCPRSVPRLAGWSLAICVSMRVRSRARAASASFRSVADAARRQTRLVSRAAVEQGAIAGPAIIESYDTTIVVPPRCTARAAGCGCIAIEMEDERCLRLQVRSSDPITFAVIKNAMDAIVDEVAYTVIRTARSEIVKDVMDYSAAICDAKGEMVAQAKTIAQHLGAIPEAMAAVQAKWGGRLKPGDAVIMNDPYSGGMHLPDIFMFFPDLRRRRDSRLVGGHLPPHRRRRQRAWVERGGQHRDLSGRPAHPAAQAFSSRRHGRDAGIH